jgi:CDGSH-type Zn-finger protein
LGSKQWVQCECGCSGPFCDSSKEAIQVWNERSAKARKEGKVRRNHPDIPKSGEIKFLDE